MQRHTHTEREREILSLSLWNIDDILVFSPPIDDILVFSPSIEQLYTIVQIKNMPSNFPSEKSNLQGRLDFPNRFPRGDCALL